MQWRLGPTTLPWLVSGVVLCGLVWGQDLNKTLSTPQTYALVIGINNYRPYPETPALPPLNFAESDARKMAQALRDPSEGRVSKVRLLLDTDASKTAIEAELRDLSRRLTTADTLVVYYSGHGMPNSQGQPSMMPSDAKTNDEETWLPLEEVQSLVKTHSGGKGRLILIVDACFSGRSQPGSRSFTLPGRKDVPKPQTPTPSGQDVVLASSSDTQPSWEDSDLGGGVFTTYLLEAMSGKGDANGDGVVTVGEAYAYAARKVEEFALRKGNAQTPKLYGPQDYPLALNPIAAGKSRIASLKVEGYISGTQFDALAAWVDGPKQPEDLRFYLSGYLTNTQFIYLVEAGAIPNVPSTLKTDWRLRRLGSLREAKKIRLEQFWVLSAMIEAGKAPSDLSEYLRGRLKEANFLQRLNAGAVRGVPR
ncbi:MAG: caspase family protein [Thermaceae bacterium]|nr:caspase family protein [Thermaceae bacterium]